MADRTLSENLLQAEVWHSCPAGGEGGTEGGAAPLHLTIWGQLNTDGGFNQATTLCLAVIKGILQ